MDHDNVISLDNEYIFGTYGRLPLVPDKALGSVITDKNGKEYIDFTSGIGVNSLGYSDPSWVSAVTAQAARFQHISNYYYCDHAAAVAEMLAKASGLSKVFFSNSGAEANEGAIKLARKYSHDKYGNDRYNIITLNNSFHGRTLTTLTATGQDKFHKDFDPFMQGFRYAEANNIDALRQACGNDTCAVMLEVIQGEGGVNVLSADYLKAVNDYCRENDILLIIDEVQTGCGRTGYPFAYQNFNLTPDIVTLAKGLAGGLPIGAFVAGKKCCDTLARGSHGSTFGGNPISCAAAEYVVSTVFSDAFLADVKRKGEYIKAKISSLSAPNVLDVRGIGLMIGIKVADQPSKYLNAAFEQGLLVLTAGSDVIRLLPPLNITDRDIDRGLDILSAVLLG